MVYRIQGWHEYFFALAQTVKQKSKDLSTQYPLTIHAEANAVANAALTGTSLKGCTLYVSAPPCADCAGLIIQAGISEVRYLRANQDFSSRWKKSYDLGLEMFETVGIKVKEHV